MLSVFNLITASGVLMVAKTVYATLALGEAELTVASPLSSRDYITIADQVISK